MSIFNKLLGAIGFLPSLTNTLYFNLTYFPLRMALKLPVFVSSNVKFVRAKGQVKINGPIGRGMIRLGYGDIPIFDKNHSRFLWNVTGTVIFNGAAYLGHGSKISVDPAGSLSIGNNLRVTAETTIICHKEISLGDDLLMSWEIQIMDTDFHQIIQAGTHINPNDSVQIGNHVWINSRALILKGTVVAEGCVVAAGALLNQKYLEPNSIIGGIPARILRKDITWKD